MLIYYLRGWGPPRIALCLDWAALMTPTRPMVAGGRVYFLSMPTALRTGGVAWKGVIFPSE